MSARGTLIFYGVGSDDNATLYLDGNKIGPSPGFDALSYPPSQLLSSGHHKLTAIVESQQAYTGLLVIAVACSPSITTTLSASTINVGTSVTDSATLSGVTADAGGTVTYYYYTVSNCMAAAVTQVVRVSVVTVTNGVVPDSAPQPFNKAGAFSWNANYSGDANNAGAWSACENLTVTNPFPFTPSSVFAVKFLCNLSPSPSAASTIGLEPGFYQTDINIHNPSFSKASVTLAEKFVVATPENVGPPPDNQFVPANPSPYVIRWVTLGPDAAVRIDCSQILSYLGPAQGNVTKGFVMIYSQLRPGAAANRVEVWAEYSAQSPEWASPSLQLVQVQPTPFIK